MLQLPRLSEWFSDVACCSISYLVNRAQLPPVRFFWPRFFPRDPFSVQSPKRHRGAYRAVIRDCRVTRQPSPLFLIRLGPLVISSHWGLAIASPYAAGWSAEPTRVLMSASCLSACVIAICTRVNSRIMCQTREEEEGAVSRPSVHMKEARRSFSPRGIGQDNHSLSCPLVAGVAVATATPTTSTVSPKLPEAVSSSRSATMQGESRPRTYMVTNLPDALFLLTILMVCLYYATMYATMYATVYASCIQARHLP
ncbi:hypothetical protein GGS23DRAFT_550193 [Durotheca rogersii]|uniref:uncharacterized protein n=1 Tax=Durotheca rogersii TaxID=419775 RepID=UPI00221F8220|nr:uncharacterized protein GGS23DRAFT_550193 [Durotheca rogersii]KAI5867825.1 hypothetical protein GGS23DRAFT_550193 [Durotheca rogersii]